jgi:hypothetical protein
VSVRGNPCGRLTLAAVAAGDEGAGGGRFDEVEESESPIGDWIREVRAILFLSRWPFSLSMMLAVLFLSCRPTSFSLSVLWGRGESDNHGRP